MNVKEPARNFRFNEGMTELGKGGLPMALDAGCVAAVLEGIEWTLSEVIERVEISELSASLDVLQNRVVALRVSIEAAETRV